MQTRNVATNLKTETKSHIKAVDVSAVDGSIRLPELPLQLRGFKNYAEPADGESELQLRSIDTV